MKRIFSRKGAKAQRRKESLRNAVALCAFAPLRERFFWVELLFGQSRSNNKVRRHLSMKHLAHRVNENSLRASPAFVLDAHLRDSLKNA
jgi:hypothetical protein